MKRIQYTILLVGIAAAAFISVNFLGKVSDYEVRASKNLDAFSNKHKSQDIKPALEYLKWLKTDPETGKLYTMNDYYRALATINAMPNRSRITSPLSWKAEGPDNIGGRTRAFLIDKDDPNLMFAAGVSGGLFRSTTGGASWKPVNDFQNELFVVSIAQGKDGIIYYGVGEGAFTGAFAATGVYKADNRDGTAFSKLGNTSSWQDVSAMRSDMNSGRIYAGSNAGFYYTEDGGSSWTKVDQGSSIGGVKDIEVASNGNVYVYAGNRAYKSTDGKTNFTPMNIPTIEGHIGSVGRIDLAVAHDDPNYVYAVVSTPNGAATYLGNLNGLYKSTDGGNEWKLVFKGGSPYADPLSQIGTLQGQGTYDLAISVDPQDKDHVYYGGVQIAEYHPSYGSKIIGSLTASVANPAYVHADKHLISWDMSKTPPTMIVGTDGGLYFSYDKGESYQRKNFGFRTTQFYGVAANSKGDLFGGTQDNGCIMVTHNGNAGADGISMNGERLLSGDGFQTEFSSIHNEYVIGESQYGNVLRSMAGGKEFMHFWDEVVGEPNDVISQRVDVDRNWAPFNTHLALYEWDSMVHLIDTFQIPVDTVINGRDTIIFNDKIEEKDSTLYTSRLFYGKFGEIWMVDGVFDFVNEPRWYRLTTTVNGSVNSLEVSPDGNSIYATTGSRNIYRIDIKDADFNRELGSKVVLPGITTTKISGTSNGLPTSRSYTSITTDPRDGDHVLVTAANYSGNQIYESFNATDASPSFTVIDNNVPNMPIYDGCFAYLNNKLHYIVGTEFGVWASDDGGASWTEENVGLARVPVYKVRAYQWHSWRDPSIFIGTYGRGMYSHNSPYHVPSGIEEDVNKVKENSGADEALKTYPNPATTYTDIEFYSKGNEEVKIDIYNISGRKVLTKEVVDSKNGKNISRVMLNNLPTGNYFIRVYSKASILGYSKIIVMN